MKRLLLVTAGILLAGATLMAQEVKFGKIEMEDLESGSYSKNPDAPAAVLYRSVVYRFHYQDGRGFHLMKDVHERIKIFDKEAYNYATVTERLYKTTGAQEGISSLRGITYNLEGGKISEDKVRRSDTFSESLNDYYNLEKFTMPNVREGSIIEYEYTVDSPFVFNIDEIALQYDIPIARQHIRIAIPEYFMFKPQARGYLPLNPVSSIESDQIQYTMKTVGTRNLERTASYSRGQVRFNLNVTTFDMRDVPALQQEPFVNSMDNYRSAIDYELLWIQYPGESRENYTTTWEKVIDRINESDRFGGQLRRTNYFKNALEGLVTAGMSDAEKTAVLFRHVQQHMAWNGLNGYITDKGVKQAYEDRSGNVGDINLMLIAMLREAGLSADPVLVSTRDHGVPVFPTRDGFNYVIARVNLGEGYVLLDATDKFAEPNLLPVRALNWFGRTIDDAGNYPSLSVIPVNASKETHIANLSFGEDGHIHGRMRSAFTDYRAYRFRNRYLGMPREEYLEQYQNRWQGMQVSEYEVSNADRPGKPVMEQLTFSLEDQWAAVGDKIYFNPMFLFSGGENPFKQEARNYPIDFAYPYQEKHTLNIELPQGYRVESLPEPVALSLANDLGTFRYQVVANGPTLQLVAQVSINKAVIPADYYAGVREFFENIVQKESEQVVLTKTTSDGTQGSTAGGR